MYAKSVQPNNMQLPIFFEEAIAPQATSYALSEETSKHCVQVLRMQPGQQIALTNGKGILYTAAIVKPDKRSTAVKILGEEILPKLHNHIAIGMSLLKNASRFEWFLEKAVEIGVCEIIPLICNRTEKQHFRYDRMRSIVIAAMLQSRQAWLPQLHEPVLLDKVLLQHHHSQKLIAHCEPGPKKTILEVKGVIDTLILIGPEGDFTTEEITKATAMGYTPVTLGHTRLRTETAGIVAATLLAS